MASLVSRSACLLAGLFILSGNTAITAADTDQVEFVVGNLMPDEGGDWSPQASPLNRPFGVDFTADGTMFIVELEGGRVFRRTPAGELTRVSGDGSRSYKGDGGPLADATYNGMHNCVVTPNGDLYIADSWNYCIRKVDAKTGVVTTVAGTGQKGFSGDNGPTVAAEFSYVMCITLNPTNDVIHIADLNNRRIRAFDLKTGLVTTVAGNGQKGIPADGSKAVDSPLADPRAVAADSKGNIYILERGGHALRVVRTDGTIHTVAGTGKQGFRDGPALQAQFGAPKHICVDGHDNVFVADDQNKAIRKYDPATATVSTVLGRGHGDKRIQLLNPHGVCWEQGQLYVVDTSHNRIMRLP
jgi:sugar lactone lactonase YvrE